MKIFLVFKDDPEECDSIYQAAYGTKELAEKHAGIYQNGRVVEEDLLNSIQLPLSFFFSIGYYKYPLVEGWEIGMLFQCDTEEDSFNVNTTMIGLHQFPTFQGTINAHSYQEAKQKALDKVLEYCKENNLPTRIYNEHTEEKS